MSRQRFRPVETFVRTGRIVAHIEDTKSGRHHWIHRQGDSLLEWDQEDRPVSNALLRREARSALEEYGDRLAQQAKAAA